jgi:PEP-CTERM motif-containing protein
VRRESRTRPVPGSGTLDQLIALNSNVTPGCTIDGLNYSAFGWNETGGNTTVLATQVSFTTSSAPGGLGLLDLSSSQFSVSGSDSLNYTLTYEIDPPPIIIRMFDQDLFDPVTFPGLADIPTTICLGAAWVGIVCSTSNTASVDTFDNGHTNQLNNSVTFAPQSTVGISTVINLQANGASASITGFGETTQITPEPASYLLVALGLAALFWLRSKRARLASISVRRSD